MKLLIGLLPLTFVLLAIAVLLWAPVATECVDTIDGLEECRGVSIGGEESFGWITVLYLGAMVVAGLVVAAVEQMQVRVACSVAIGVLVILGAASVGLLFLPALIASVVVVSRTGAAARRE